MFMQKVLTRETAFRSVAACPWCGSGEPDHRAPAKEAFGSKSNKYLDAIAERIDLPVSTLIASMDTFECRTCGTAYCDPWLSQPATEWLFSLGYPQHHSGWLRFFAWLDRSPNYQKVYAPRAERIWAYLGNRLGTIAAYGEIGCPFTGLFTYFQELLQTPQESFARFEAHCAEQAKTAPQPMYVGRLQSLVRAATAMKGWKNRRRWRRSPPASSTSNGSAATTLPDSLSYFRAPSSLSWQASCQALGCSCSATVMGNFDVDVTEFSKLNSRFDVLGFYKTLDHQDRPLQALEKALQFARAVIIEAHPDTEAGKQHLFVINEALERTAHRNGWFFEEFSEQISGSDRFYLVALEPPTGRT